MNALLFEVSSQVREAVDSHGNLLQILDLLPQNIADAKALQIRDDKESQDFLETMQQIFDLEAEKDLTESTKDLLSELIFKALNLVNASEHLQELLQNGKKGFGDNKRILENLKNYLAAVRDVGCRNISISHDEDKQNSSNLFKTIDRCNVVLRPQLLQMEEALELRSEEVEEESSKYSDLISDLKEKLSLIKDEMVMVCNNEEETVENELKELKKVETEELGKLVEELERKQQLLQSLTKKQLTEQLDLLDELKQLTDGKARLEEEHKLHSEAKKLEIQNLNMLIEREEKERVELAHKVSLEDKNRDILENERVLLKVVEDREKAAFQKLFDSATVIQKRIRGIRDRNAFLKLKKKKNKKKGGKKKGKK
ncbi:predicted protein [Chaetoceros tenuissimus]|uniref:Dynein regulatory complex protein 10 n=1 Tax=Chaetoceros tenuissimus TaxID=426638 RepID=A0AAD3CQQ0_9STRA|nr:predicted protein [Chaetoceros tenuissimus]